MSKKVWKAGTMLYPAPPVMVTCGTAEKPNVFTVAWTGIVNSEPPMTYVSVRPERYSYGLIKETGEFVINLTTADMLNAADFCGVKSGKDIDKFAETGLTAVSASAVSAPLLSESPLSLECRVKEVKSLGSHDMFLAEIVAVDVDESLLDESGRLQLEKARLAAFCHGRYYAVGAELGTFGFSVVKKKTRKRRIAEIKEKRKEDRIKKERETEKRSVDDKDKERRPRRFGRKGSESLRFGQKNDEPRRFERKDEKTPRFGKKGGNRARPSDRGRSVSAPRKKRFEKSE